ncbi:response regulator transcription factor [bacterium]|nr:response regulator transcription factor [bacterium]
MKLLILEDEPPIAEHIAWMCRKILGDRITACKLIHTLDEAERYIAGHQIDILLLDLNLEGKNGYAILKRSVAGSFHTIIISAHTDQAVTAFAYGVLDFIPKPFNEQRLREAFTRYDKRTEQRELATKYIAVRETSGIHLIDIADITYIKAAGNYSEAVLRDGSVQLIVKSLNMLEKILPASFERIHKSYLINMTLLDAYQHAGGGTYRVILKDGTSLPLSRPAYKRFQKAFR